MCFNSFRNSNTSLKEERELLHENARASVWPRLGIDISRSHDPVDGSLNHFTLSLSNSGVGPAIITDVKVSYKGKAAKTWWELCELPCALGAG